VTLKGYIGDGKIERMEFSMEIDKKGQFCLIMKNRSYKGPLSYVNRGTTSEDNHSVRKDFIHL